MKYKYITIEREYGSGGEKIARETAKQCGYHCYGREILELVAEKYDCNVDEVEKYEENVTGSFLYSIYMMSKAQSGDPDMLSGEGHLYLAEQTVIKELAEQGPAIFVGHCAGAALEEKNDVLHVFIGADKESKKQRCIEEYGIDKGRVESMRKRFDKKRSNYYYANTTRKWNDSNNYDLILDSGKLGVDGCVAALKGLWTNL